MMILRLCLTIVFAYLIGKLVSKIKLPAILGWLLAGMIFGPHAFSIMSQDILDANWYQTGIHILECAVGLMIGTELVWNKIKKSGKSIIITTLTQSLGTFIVVSLVFGIIFYFMDIPLYLSLIFGGIALATAPAPALSIVREFKTDGPVTKTLIPMAALDDIVGCVVFFSVIAIVAGQLSAGSLPTYMIVLIVVLPILIGIVCGFISGFILKKEMENRQTLLVLVCTIVFTSIVGFYFNNNVMTQPILNFMLIGMAFSATFSNMVSEERLEQMMRVFNPYLGVSMIIVILNLGAPLDYHLIFGAGLFTAVYIIARAFGKYFGAYFGASITHSSDTIKKYLGLTLLPHSGVSLVFTGIAVSILQGPDPDSSQIIQGTIAAAAVINEVIAVIMAKKGFEWAGEFNQNDVQDMELSTYPIITISRQYGSGGRDIALELSQQLNIPFYDNKLVELASENSVMDRRYFEKYETRQSVILNELSQSVAIGTSLDDRVYDQNSKTIKSISKQGSCILVGRCSDYILKSYPKVIRVFIYGDLEKRKDRIINVYKEDSHKADELIEKVDKARKSYYNYYSHQEFGAAQNYDLCLNSSTLGIERCVEIIKETYENFK